MVNVDITLVLLDGCEATYLEKDIVSKGIHNKADDILKEIEDFQNKYFEIIKRLDVLLSFYVENYERKEAEELSNLFPEDKYNPWLRIRDNIGKDI